MERDEKRIKSEATSEPGKRLPQEEPEREKKQRAADIDDLPSGTFRIPRF